MFSLSNLEALLPTQRLGRWDVEALSSAGETVYGLTAAWGHYAQVWRSDHGLQSGFEQRVDQLAGPYLHLLALTEEIVLLCGAGRRVLRSVDGEEPGPSLGAASCRGASRPCVGWCGARVTRSSPWQRRG